MKWTFAGLRGDVPAKGGSYSRTVCAFIALLVMLTACACLVDPFFRPNPDPELIVADSEIEVFWYVDGRPERTRTLASGSSDARAVLALLRSHRGHWMRSFVSYAPCLFLRGSDFSVDIHSDMIVWCYIDKGWDVQVTSPTRGMEANLISDALKHNSLPFDE